MATAHEVKMRHKHVFGLGLINGLILAGPLALKPACEGQVNSPAIITLT